MTEHQDLVNRFTDRMIRTALAIELYNNSNNHEMVDQRAAELRSLASGLVDALESIR